MAGYGRETDGVADMLATDWKQRGRMGSWTERWTRERAEVCGTQRKEAMIPMNAHVPYHIFQ